MGEIDWSSNGRRNIDEDPKVSDYSAQAAGPGQGRGSKAVMTSPGVQPLPRQIFAIFSSRSISAVARPCEIVPASGWTRIEKRARSGLCNFRRVARRKRPNRRIGSRVLGVLLQHFRGVELRIERDAE